MRRGSWDSSTTPISSDWRASSPAVSTDTWWGYGTNKEGCGEALGSSVSDQDFKGEKKATREYHVPWSSSNTRVQRFTVIRKVYRGKKWAHSWDGLTTSNILHLEGVSAHIAEGGSVRLKTESRATGWTRAAELHQEPFSTDR